MYLQEFEKNMDMQPWSRIKGSYSTASMFPIIVIRNRNLLISRVPLKSQTQGTSLFTSTEFTVIW